MAVDYAGYERMRRNIMSDYAAKAASNDYGRFVSQQRGSRAIGDLTQNFQRSWAPTVASWMRRGANPQVNSGFYQQAMQNYVGDYQQRQNDLQQQNAQQDYQFGLSAAQLEAEKQRALAELEAQKQAQIANLAMNIQAIKPYV